MFDIRLMLYDIDEPVGVIPQAQGIQAAFPLNDSPTLQFTIPTDLPDSISYEDILKWIDDYDVALQWSDEQGIWKEEPSCRFVFKNDSSNLTQKNDQYSLTAIGVDWDLTGMVNLKTSTLNSEGKHVFENATPGGIVKWMIDTAQAEDLGTAIKYDFTEAQDSAGNAWPNKLTMSVAPEVNVHQVLESLQSQGQLDWRFNGFTLQLYVADTAMRRDRDMEFIIGREVDSAPQKRDRSDIANKVLVVGDEGRYLVRSLPTNRRRGSRAIVQTQSGVKDTGTMTVLADATLKEHSEDSEELTREYVCTPAMVTTPLKDFLPGDRIYANGASGAIELLRVAQITVEKTVGEDGNVKGNILLQDRYLEDLLKQKRRIDGIVNGAAVGGGTGGRPTPPSTNPSGKPPKAPTGLSVTSEAYVSDIGDPLAVLTANWDAVTQGIDGKDLEKEVLYEVGARPTSEMVWGTGIGLTTWPRTSETNAARGAMWAGVEYQVAVRAWVGTERSAWSEFVTVVTAKDDLPPQRPSAPILTTRAGTISAEWDGKDYTGGTTWPKDMVGVNVYISGEQVYKFNGGITSAPLGAYLPGSIINVTFRAVDVWGNESEDSDVSTITVASVITEEDIAAMREVIDDMVASADGKSQVYWSRERPEGDTFSLGATWFQYSDNEARNIVGMYRWDGEDWRESTGFSHEVLASLDLGKATIGELEGNRIKANSIESDRLIVDQALADKVMAHVVVADHIDAGSITGVMLKADAINGKTITGATIIGSTIRTSSTANRGIALSSDGTMQAWNGSGVRTVNINGTSNNIVGDFSTNIPGKPQLVMVNATSQGQPGIWFSPTGTTSGNVSAIYRQTSGMLTIRSVNYDDPTSAPQGLYVDDNLCAPTISCVPNESLGGLWGGFKYGRGGTTMTSLYIESSYASGYMGTPIFSGMGTTSTATNCVVDGNNRLWKHTSARRFKLDISDLDVDADKVLDVRPVKFHDKAAYEDSSDGLSREWIPGAIAEEVDDLGLGMFVPKNEDGQALDLMYERLWILLIPVVKKLKARVEELEERIDNGNAA